MSAYATKTPLQNYYTSEHIDKIVHQYNGRNYITAVDTANNITQLAIETDTQIIADFDDGSSTFYNNVMAPNLRQTYTYNNEGATGMWIYLGVLNTTQGGGGGFSSSRLHNARGSILM
jgi:hypothetical protein